MTDITRAIHCCACKAVVQARLTNGVEIYPHRPDLHALPFWKCDGCRNHVGCHHKHHEPHKRTQPLGVIPDAPMREARLHIHAILDPLWQSHRMPRGKIYAKLSKVLGRQYHTAELRTLEEARSVYRAVQAIARDRANV